MALLLHSERALKAKQPRRAKNRHGALWSAPCVLHRRRERNQVVSPRLFLHISPVYLLCVFVFFTLVCAWEATLSGQGPIKSPTNLFKRQQNIPNVWFYHQIDTISTFWLELWHKTHKTQPLVCMLDSNGLHAVHLFSSWFTVVPLLQAMCRLDVTMIPIILLSYSIMYLTQLTFKELQSSSIL